MVEKKKTGETVGLPVGSKIGKYEVRERIGVGGQAVVYKCLDPLLDREVAVKQISTHLAEDPAFLQRFRQEAKILARLGSEQPAIVTIYELVEDERGLFIVMEYVPGNTLETILRDNPDAIEPKAALQILWRLAAALNAVHTAGIVHRDIKPGNIIIGDGLRAKIMDFGVAASMAGQASMPLGTTKYMAPELFEGGSVDARVDIYSLGFIAYEMLVGRRLFNEIFADVVRDPSTEVVRWMKWHGNRAVHAPMLHEINPSVPPQLSEIVARMIAKDPERRFANMEELGRAIRGAFSPRRGGKSAAGAPMAAEPPAPTQPSQAPASPAASGSVQSRRSSHDSGVAMNSDDLQIVMPAVKAAPSSPPLPAEPDEAAGPATAPLPRRQLTKKAKLIMLAGGGVLLLIVLVAVMLVRDSGRRSRDEARAAAFMKAQKELTDALPPEGDLAGFQAAAKDFKQVQGAYPGTIAASKASVLECVAQGYVFVCKGEWDSAETSKKEADARLRTVVAAGSNNKNWAEKDLGEWRNETAKVVEGLDSHRNVSQTFALRLKLARAMLDSVVAMDQAREDVKASTNDTKAEVVRRSREAVESAMRNLKSDETEIAEATVKALSAAEQQLQKLSGSSIIEIRRTLLGAEQAVVAEADSAIGKLKEYSERGAKQQRKAVDGYYQDVKSAQNTVSLAVTMANQDRLLGWVQDEKTKMDRYMSELGAQLNSAGDQARQGLIDEAKKLLGEAGKTRANLENEYTFPRGMPQKQLDELKQYQRELLDKMAGEINSTTTAVKVAENNIVKLTELRKCMDNAAVAGAKGDWESDLTWLRKARELASQVKPDEVKAIDDQMAAVQLKAELDQAMKLMAGMRYDRAIPILEGILARDPRNSMAQAALKECQGKVKWATFVSAGDRAMTDRKWDEAIDSYNKAQNDSPTKEVADKLAECKFNKGLEEGDALFAADKLDQARAAYEKLKPILPAKLQIVLDRIRQVEQRQKYVTLVSAAVDAMKNKKWVDARRLYSEAAAIYTAAADAARNAVAQTGLNKAMYEDEMEKAEKSLHAGSASEAKAHYETAKKYAKTELDLERIKEGLKAVDMESQNQKPPE